MNEGERRSPTSRALDAVRKGIKSAIQTAWFLLRIMVPVSLVVALLGWSGILTYIARFLSPAMSLLDLPGEGALVFISSALLGIYSGIAVAGSLTLNLREVAILAIMCLTAHNLLIESTVMRKAGSSAAKMVVLRLGVAVLAGWAYSLLLPASLASIPFSGAAAGARPDFWPMLAAWALSTGKLVLRMVTIVVVIMVAQRLLEEFKIMDFLSRLLSPLMRLFGLAPSASFLWIVINIVGYGYGAGIIMEQIESGRMKPQEGDLFNHHAAICHSLFEDTTIFLSLGVPFFWLTVPRLVLAIASVWLERLRRRYVRRSFRVGIG